MRFALKSEIPNPESQIERSVPSIQSEIQNPESQIERPETRIN